MLFVFGTTMATPAAAATPAAEPPATAAEAAGLALDTVATSAPRDLVAEGSFAVRLDPTTLRAVPVANGTLCRLSVAVELELDGTARGTASGTTTALVQAPCPQVLSVPPGTFADSFTFRGDFSGNLAGVDTRATVEYAGITELGGRVTASLTLHGWTSLAARALASAGEAGSYLGMAILRGPNAG